MVIQHDCFNAAVNLCRQTHTQWESGIMDNPNMKDRKRGEFINKSVFKLIINCIHIYPQNNRSSGTCSCICNFQRSEVKLLIVISTNINICDFCQPPSLGIIFHTQEPCRVQSWDGIFSAEKIIRMDIWAEGHFSRP